jgi:hypothetical protein
MKKAGKKLMVSAFVLMVAMSLAVTSTYAWFTMSSTPSVEGYDVNVTSQDGLLVSATYNTTDTFKGVLPFADIKAANPSEFGDGGSVEPKKLGQVTSINGVSDFSVTTGVEKVTDDIDTLYIEYDLYFMSTAKMAVYLNDAGNTVTSVDAAAQGAQYPTYFKTSTANYFGSHNELTSGTVLNNAVGLAAQNAVRYSFQQMTVAEIPVEVSKFTWYPNPEKGIWKGTGFIPSNLTETTQAGTFAQNFAYVYYNYFDQTFELDSNVTEYYKADAHAAWLAASDAYSRNYYKGDEGNYIAKDRVVLLQTGADAFNGYYTAHVVVRMWLEGWDGDCANAILQDKITSNLQFCGVKIDGVQTSEDPRNP